MEELNGISYYRGYKYQLCNKYFTYTDVKPFKDIETQWVKLCSNGVIIINKGYAWDGATCCPDLKSIIRASLIHDALCQLIELGLLPESYRSGVDSTLHRLCIEDGMNPIIAKIIIFAVRLYSIVCH